jgi:hypothetical protein
MKKTHNNTIIICLTLGLLTGSVLAGLMIDQDWYVFTAIFALSFGIAVTTHGKEKVSALKQQTNKL